MVLRQTQISAITVEGGDLPWERRIDVDHQVAAQAEFFQRHAVQPCRKRIHPQRFPVFRKRIFQPGNGNVVQHQCVPVAQPVAGGAHHAPFPAGSELTQRNALRGEFRVQDRVKKMQRAVDKFAGVHG